MTRRTAIASSYVVAASLLLAMGAAARYSEAGSKETMPSENSSQMRQGQMGQGQMGQGQTGQGMMRGQMGQGRMGQNQTMVAVREKMRGLVDQLMGNQEAMEKAKSMRSIKPLLAKNRTLLGELSNDMAQSWGMRGAMRGRGAAMGGRMGSTSPQRPAPSPAPSGTASSNAAQNKLVAHGKEVFAASGCRVCHGAQGTGTAMAPSLVGVGKKYSAEKIGELIRHPATTTMPTFSVSALPQADLSAVVAYLETLK